MATWTAIPNASLEPGAPARSIDAIALRDNVTALAEGASGAPKIVNAAHLAPVAGNTYAVPMMISQKSTAGTSYVSLMGLTEPEPSSSITALCLVGGSIRCTLSHKSGDPGVTLAYARILKNGSVVTEWSTTSGTMVGRSVDVSVSAGDLIQFQQRTNNSSFIASWENIYIKSATANFFIA